MIVTTDELALNWNKKITMKEIAQFYEDKLRDLEAKQSMLVSDMTAKLSDLENKLTDLTARAKIAIDFLSKYDDVKNMIEEERKEHNDSLHKMLDDINEKQLNFYHKEVERVMDAQQKGVVSSTLRAMLEGDQLAITFYAFLLKHFPADYQILKESYKAAQRMPELFLSMATNYIHNDKDVDSEYEQKVLISVIKNIFDSYLDMFSSIEAEAANDEKGK